MLTVSVVVGTLVHVLARLRLLRLVIEAGRLFVKLGVELVAHVTGADGIINIRCYIIQTHFCDVFLLSKNYTVMLHT